MRGFAFLFVVAIGWIAWFAMQFIVMVDVVVPTKAIMDAFVR